MTNNDSKPIPITCIQETTNAGIRAPQIETIEETSISEWPDTLNLMEGASVDLNMDFRDPSRDVFHSFRYAAPSRAFLQRSIAPSCA